MTAQQVRHVVALLLEAGRWSPGDAEILLVADAGYDGPRLAFLLQDLPVTVLVRMRSDQCCAARHQFTCRAPWAGHVATVTSSCSVTRPPGETRT